MTNKQNLIERLEFRLPLNQPNGFKHWEVAELNGTRYCRYEGSKIIYVEKKLGDVLSCVECDSKLEQIAVRHSVHNGPGELCGGGEVINENVAYCPNCETKPNPYGSPINE